MKDTNLTKRSREACSILAPTTLRVTPAMASDVSDHVWSLEEIVNLLP
jgi:hypothetical protein